MAVSGSTQAQTIEAAADGVGTVVQSDGSNTTTIQGGIQAEGNLFHSLQEFNIAPNQTALFLTEPTVENVITRVVGGQSSVLQGNLALSGSQANFYLMNPSGILFGRNFQLDIPGSFTATTADGIRFGEDWFGLYTDPGQIQQLTEDPNAFAFVADNSNGVDIINSATIQVEDGESVTLIGEKIKNTGDLSAPSSSTLIVTADPDNQILQIGQEGSILRLDLPLDVADALLGRDAAPPVTFLPDLLTGGHSESDSADLVVHIKDDQVQITSPDSSPSTPSSPPAPNQPQPQDQPQQSNITSGSSNLENESSQQNEPRTRLNQTNQIDPASNSSATNPARLDSQGLDAGANSDVAGLSLMPIITSSSNQSSYQNASLSETEIVTDLFASSDRNRAAFNLEITELDQSISQAYADYFGELNHQVMSLQQTQTLLQQVQTERGLQSAVIYAMFKEPTVATSAPDESYLELMLVLPSGDSIRKTVNVSRDRVLRQAQLWRMAVPDAADPQSFRPLSQQFYGWLLAPLEAELQQHQITNLMFILDDGLRTLPLAALMDDDGYVVQRYSLAILPSMGLLDQSLHPTFDRSIVAMGADSFVTSDLDSEPLEPLPAVPLELQMVQHKSNRADVLLNETFTVDNFLALQRQQPGIVHLATHAEFQAGQPQASYIQFWDARLGLDQVRSLNWNDGDLDLLILSACTTALGSSEAELGFAGLASAAGVRTVIGSLWQVSDVATLALMSEFYAQLATAPSIAEAMRQAQLSLLQGSVRVENNLLITPNNTVELPRNLAVENPVVLDHPAYWSAFALVGNPW